MKVTVLDNAPTTNPITETKLQVTTHWWWLILWLLKAPFGHAVDDTVPSRVRLLKVRHQTDKCCNCYTLN